MPQSKTPFAQSPRAEHPARRRSRLSKTPLAGRGRVGQGALLLSLLLLPALAHAQVPLLTLTSPSPEADGYFGQSVSGVPDADGDGVADLLVGAGNEAVTGGRAYLFSGATGALIRTLSSPNPEANGVFGFSVSGVPDADGDGRGDVLVGAAGESDGVGAAGQVYLFSGATGVLLRTLTSANPTTGGNFGFSVSGVADADGDGRGDLLVGARDEDSGVSEAGRAYLFSGATGAVLQTLLSPNPKADGEFGHAVSGVPDTDGDGRGDVLVGAFLEDGGTTGDGRAYLFSGASGALLRTLQSLNPETGGQFGHAVSGVPDADGDGRGDVLVGAGFEDGGAQDAGRAYLFSGASGTLLRTLVSPDPRVEGFFGFSASGVPDTNADGRGDVLVGAGFEFGGAANARRAYLFSGDTGALLLTLVSPNPKPGGSFGFSVSGVADTDDDDLGDVLVSAVFEDGGASNAGRAYLFRGSTLVASEPGPETPTPGLTVTPNPARGRAVFTLSLPAAGAVRLAVHDALGREVALLVDGARTAGAHAVVFDVRDLASGVYTWHLATDGAVQTGRLTLLD